ncbi:MAG: Pilus assembly protein [uncultured bacterium]|nr:MAG: Pilus assembly protein [uncultured bacterium]HBG19796.1 conjugal transfer protein TraB [Desulfobulbaceae bacterium]
MNVKERFNQLSPGRKKAVIWLLVGAVILLFVASGYNSSRTDKAQSLFGQHKTREIQLEPELIQKTLLREQRSQLDALQAEIDNIKKERLKTESEAKSTEKEEKEFPEIPSPDQLEQQVLLPRPLTSPPPPPPKSAQQQPQLIGNITVLANATPVPGNIPENDKKKARTVYLPPSFMEASLLTGFDASTSGTGKNSPEPLLLRIQTPAVLPNDIKANLAGCFIIAEAVGRLDKERADVRLVSLSCLSNEGKAIIDTQVKGFVTDSDSKVGLSGRVVSRMGAATARTVIAGFFGGLGDMLKTTATTQSVSPLGTTTSVDSSQIAKYSVGGGLAEGSQSLRDFYLDLAKQATPVIEVGATKKITVVISEGKDLEIKDKEGDTLQKRL